MMLGWLKTVKYDTWSWKVSDLKVAKLRVGTSKLGWRKLGRMRTRQTMEESHTILNYRKSSLTRCLERPTYIVRIPV